MALVASADGVVHDIFEETGFPSAGKGIEINHGNRWFSLSLHLNSWSVPEGQTVRQDQQIGVVGTSGTEAAHVHYELRYDWICCIKRSDAILTGNLAGGCPSERPPGGAYEASPGPQGCAGRSRPQILL